MITVLKKLFMKQIYIALLMFAPVVAIAQGKIDRTKAPKPAPARKIEIADPASFTLSNGLKVYVVQNSKLPRVSATLTIDRDPLVEGDKTGLTSLAGSLLTRGTQTKSKAALDEEIDFLGANLSGSSNSLYVASLKKNFSKAMDLMAEVAFRPALSAEELEKIRKQSITGLQAAKDNPNAIAENVVNRLVYGKDHPYGDIETEATLKNVTLEDIKNYFNTYWKPGIAYLVFVGDITSAEAKRLAEKHFSNWKKGEVPAKNYAMPNIPSKTYIALVDRPASVQSVITLVTPIELKPGSANAIPSSVMNEILGSSSGRLFANLREKYGFTYGAYSSTRSDKLVGQFSASASVRSEKTDSAIAQFLYELNRIRTEAVSEEEVTRMKNYLSGSFARSLEQPSAIAGFALNIARYNLPKDYYRNYLTNLSNVGASDVQKMADTYVLPGNMHIVIVGNAKAIAPGLEKYGEVKYFDIYGNEVAKPVEKKVDAAVTAESVIQKAIDATGGAKKIADIKDVSLSGSVNIMGTELSITEQYLVSVGYTRKVDMAGMGTVMSEVMNGSNFTKSQQGQSQPLEDKDKEEMKEDGSFFQELYMKNNGYNFTLKGIEAVEGSDAYVIEVKSPLGRVFTNYYDVKSGLKVKDMSEEESPRGKMVVQTYYSGYKEKNDVKIPTKIVVDLGRFKQEIEYKDVKVNTGLKAGDIK
jgi:zinc protease